MLNFNRPIAYSDMIKAIDKDITLKILFKKACCKDKHEFIRKHKTDITRYINQLTLTRNK